MIPISAVSIDSGMSVRRLQVLCKAGRIKGAKIVGRLWMVPYCWSITPGKRGPRLR